MRGRPGRGVCETPHKRFAVRRPARPKPAHSRAPPAQEAGSSSEPSASGVLPRAFCGHGPRHLPSRPHARPPSGLDRRAGHPNDSFQNDAQPRRCGRAKLPLSRERGVDPHGEARPPQADGGSPGASPSQKVIVKQAPRGEPVRAAAPCGWAAARTPHSRPGEDRPSGRALARARNRARCCVRAGNRIEHEHEHESEHEAASGETPRIGAILREEIELDRTRPERYR